MRNVPAEFETAAAATASGETYRVLEVRFPVTVGGTQFFAGGTPTVDGALPVVIDWGSLSLSPKLRTLSGFGQVDMTLADPTMTLAFAQSAKPGGQNVECFVHLYMGGDAGATDGPFITEFGGTLGKATQWSSSGGTWKIQIDGFEKFYNRDLGIKYERASFPEARCSDCPDSIVPIVYGEEVKRIKCCPIDLPGSGFLGATIFLCDDRLYLHATAEQLGFPSGVDITLIVGFPPNTEQFTGSFATPDTNEFIFGTNRSSIFWAGVVDDVYAESGVQYYVFDVAATPVLRGYPLVFPNQDCSVEMITHWIETGGDYALVVKGDRTFGAGEPAWILRTIGYYNIWPKGTPVNEKAPWVFAVNTLPMMTVDVVEARAEAQGNGGNQNVWAEYDPAYYSYILDDRTYNTALGRDPGDDPGITTVTIFNSPAAAGFSDPTIYVTGNGIANDDDDLITHPVEIIRHLVTNPFLGGLPDSKIDGASFTAATADLDAAALAAEAEFPGLEEDEELSPVAMQFAITKPVKLWDTVADIAMQAGGLLSFFDMGKLVLRHYAEGTPASGDIDLTFDTNMMRPGTLTLGEVDAKEMHNYILTKWRADQQGAEGTMVRRSPEAVNYFGKNELAVQAWCYQDRLQVARLALYMLKKSLDQNRIIGLQVYHVGALLQPGDAVRVNVGIPGGYALNNRGRVRSIGRTAISVAQSQMETYNLGVEVARFTWTTQATEIEACDRVPGVVLDPYRNTVLQIGFPARPIPSSSSSSSSDPPSSSSSSSSDPPPSSSGPPGSEPPISEPATTACQPCDTAGVSGTLSLTWAGSTTPAVFGCMIGKLFTTKSLKCAARPSGLPNPPAAPLEYGTPPGAFFNYEYFKYQDCAPSHPDGNMWYVNAWTAGVSQLSPTEWTCTVTFKQSPLGIPSSEFYTGSSADPVGDCNGPFPFIVKNHLGAVVGSGVFTPGGGSPSGSSGGLTSGPGSSGGGTSGGTSGGGTSGGGTSGGSSSAPSSSEPPSSSGPMAGSSSSGTVPDPPPDSSGTGGCGFVLLRYVGGEGLCGNGWNVVGDSGFGCLDGSCGPIWNGCGAIDGLGPGDYIGQYRWIPCG